MSDRGTPLAVVHRDVSPQNILVGFDGVARVADFGVAKAVGRLQTTVSGQIKGKLSYLAPEQLERADIDRRVDVYGAAVVLWELLTGRRLFKRASEARMIHAILRETPPRPSEVAPHVPRELDAIVLKGLARERDARFATAEDMALAIEDAISLPHTHEVGAWVRSVSSETMELRRQQLCSVESMSAVMTMLPKPTLPQGSTWRGYGRLGVTLSAMAVGAAVLSYVGSKATSSPSAATVVRSDALAGRVLAASDIARGEAERDVSLVGGAERPRDMPTPPPAADAGVNELSGAPGEQRPRATPLLRRKNVALSQRPRESCEPPFVVDATGIKIPKPACVR
jgi:serine/threonine-protein kinase